MATTVVISGSASEDAHDKMKEDVLAVLFSQKAGLPVLLVPHIYHVPEEGEFRQTLAAIDGPIVLVSWLHPRPAEWILRWFGVTVPVLALNIAAYDTPEACFKAFAQSAFAPSVSGTAATAATVKQIDFDVPDRWYPVIDGSRCANCKQCQQFCLFGVYELDDAGKVRVRKPDNCKHGCPACSRICPRGAIMFPLHDDHAIAGAPGKFMAPDGAAKAMFYARTKRPCPVCGSVFTPGRASPKPGAANVCKECGRAIASGDSPKPAAGKPDDLDTLIDDLERLR